MTLKKKKSISLSTQAAQLSSRLLHHVVITSQLDKELFRGKKKKTEVKRKKNEPERILLN